jgi:hypothetical protein
MEREYVLFMFVLSMSRNEEYVIICAKSCDVLCVVK